MRSQFGQVPWVGLVGWPYPSWGKTGVPDRVAMIEKSWLGGILSQLFFTSHLFIVLRYIFQSLWLICYARWGVVERIERPLLMLEVQGSNPGHSI